MKERAWRTMTDGRGGSSDVDGPRGSASGDDRLEDDLDAATRIDRPSQIPSSRPPPPPESGHRSATAQAPLDDAEPERSPSPVPESVERTEVMTGVGDRTFRQVLRPAGVGDLTASTSSSSATGSSTILSHDALVRERWLQARNGLIATLAGAIFGAAALQFSTHRPATHYYATAAMLFLAAIAGWQLRDLMRSDKNTASLAIGAVGAASVVVTLAVTAHVGVLSPIVIFLPVQVYYMGLSDMQGRAWIVYLTAAVGYLVLCVLAAVGILPLTEGTLPLATQSLRSLAILGTVIEVVLGLTFVMARVGRKTTLQAMEQLESARREIRQREAQLEEARDELDRALDAGKIGRFTGRDVGPYVAHEIVGRGGMGEVYRAVHAETNGEAALKILHVQLLEEEDHVERFFREAEISSNLESPHIVEVLGTGHARDGSPYLAMELLIGQSLSQILREHGKLKTRDVVTMVTQVAQALTVAQEAGIVHRDLKPQNVFRRGDGLWKVLDFGVSKIASVAATVTRGGEIVGTPGYMSPEQARGQPVDHRSDVFSLGILAYRALTGRPAFHAPDAIAILYNVMENMPVRPSEVAKLDPDVDLALALALAKDRERRLRSATSFAAALHDAARGELDDRLREAAQALLAVNPWEREDEDAPRDAARPL